MPPLLPGTVDGLEFGEIFIEDGLQTKRIQQPDKSGDHQNGGVNPETIPAQIPRQQNRNGEQCDLRTDFSREVPG